MTEYTAQCHDSDRDKIIASKCGESVQLLAQKRGDFRLDVFLTPTKAREFAAGVVALADELEGVKPTAPIRIGDRVEIVTYRTYDSTHNGQRGTVTVIDTDDIPYRVAFDDGRDSCYAVSVRRLDDEPATVAHVPVVSVRGDLVTQAKALLADTDHTGADIVAMAAYLAAG